MIKQTILTGLFVTILSGSLVGTAFAQSVTPELGKPLRGAARNATTLDTLCTNAINQRLTSLNTIKTRVSNLVKLSDTQKQQFTSEITTDITALQALQTQCTTDFNAGNTTALKTDYHDIFTQYRIYAIFIPQVDLLAAADTMSVTATKLSDFATKLQSRIQSAGSPSNLTSLLSDMQAKISDANTQVNTINSSVTSLTPQSYNTDPGGSSATMKSARADLKTGRADLDTAWKDAKQILQGLKVTLTPTPGS